MREPPGILPVGSVHHIGQRADGSAIIQPDLREDLEIDAVDLLAFGQVGVGGLDLLRRDAEGHPRQEPPRSSPITRPGFSAVPRWRLE